MDAAGLHVCLEHVKSKYQWVFIIPERTTNLLELNQMPLRLMIYSLHPLLHPFIAAMGIVVMVTVSLQSLSPDCDLCRQEEKGL